MIIGANLADKAKSKNTNEGKSYVIFGCNYSSTDPTLLCQK